MPFFTNDKTFWKRASEGDKTFITKFLPLWVMIWLVMLIIFFNKMLWMEILMLSFIISEWLFSLADIFTKYPHINIPDWYSKDKQKIMYIAKFIIVSIGLYIIAFAILYKYYPFLDMYICCDFIKKLSF